MIDPNLMMELLNATINHPSIKRVILQVLYINDEKYNIETLKQLLETYNNKLFEAGNIKIEFLIKC